MAVITSILPGEDKWISIRQGSSSYLLSKGNPCHFNCLKAHK